MANRPRNRSGAKPAGSGTTVAKGRTAPNSQTLPKISATKDGGVSGANRKERKDEARRQREALMRKQSRRRVYRVMGIAAAAVVVLVLVLVFAVFKKSPTVKVPQSQLPGLITTTDTRLWNTANTADLAARLKDLKLPPLGPEKLAFHVHQELKIFIGGKQVTLPAFVGIDQASGQLSELHVHATDGVIHVESPTQRTFSLGDFMGVWGMNFTPTSIGGFKNGNGKDLRVFVNGRPYTGDPTKLVLKNHEIIVVTFGTQAQVPSPIPNSFAWASSSAGG